MAGSMIHTLLLAFEALGASSLSIAPLSDQHFPSPYACFTKHPDYNARQCEEGALGMTLDSLRNSVLVDDHATRRAKVNQSNCSKNVKIFTISEMEAQFPKLAECWLSTYAGQLQFGAQIADCQVENIDDAHALFIPAYLAQECNWPHYGDGQCFHQANTFREGHVCREEALGAASFLMKQHKKPVIINDMNPWENLSGHEPDAIWAKINLRPKMFIQHHTISQAPPPTWPRGQMCSTNITSQCYGAALTEKKYTMTFKGSFVRNQIRGTLAERYHKPSEGVVVVDNDDEQYDFDDLLFNSKFLLILPGDAAFSYRFTEAVCSGGIPVLVTDNWVPPFGRIVPFKKYGIRVGEGMVRLGLLMAELNKYNTSDLERMRLQAREVCEKSINNVALQAHNMISEALSIVL